jgi:hypothetical protein
MTMPGRAAIVVLIALSIPSAAIAGDRLEVDGYLKSFVVGIHPASYTNQDQVPRQDFLWANNNRARANAAVYFSNWLDCHVSYDLSLRIQDDVLFTDDPFRFFQVASVYRVDDLNPIIWPDDPGEGDHVALMQNLDRLYLGAHAGWFDFYFGRQVIAWGSAKAINPTDIIAPFLYTEIDYEDRIGVDAARLRVPTGPLGEVDVGYVAGQDFRWKESAAFARCRFYTLETDVSLLVMAFRQNALAGFDITRAIGGAGAWCEAAYVWARLFDDRPSDGDEADYLRLSAGADYNFGAGVYTFLEYHFNGAGASDPHDYTQNVLSNPTAYADGAVYYFGRHYVIPGVVWQVTALTSLSGQVLANLSDGSCLLAPYLEYNATDNLYLSFGGYLAIGDNPTATVVAGSPVDSPSVVPRFNSEFGAYPSEYYAFLRYYF